ncbi:MAG: IS481 family transposase [Rhizobiales bacterium]|nr:IS481 family transposase [Hyphomicrobiales bacterium]
MSITLTKRATTTAKIRAAIQASAEPARVLAERYGISEQTVWKWRKRDNVHDRSRMPHRLQTTLTPAQEMVVVALRTSLLVPLDDLLFMVREFLNPHVSRSGLDRCLRRHKVGNLRALKLSASKPGRKSAGAQVPGHLDIDLKCLPQMADGPRRRYLLFAVDRVTKWAFVRLYSALTAADARSFLHDLERAAPMRIARATSRSGAKCNDRSVGPGSRSALAQSDFARFCAEFETPDPLGKTGLDEAGDIAERFEGRIGDVLQGRHFRSGEALENTIQRYVRLYNFDLAQSALEGRTPIEALDHWRRLRPDLFEQ